MNNIGWHLRQIDAVRAWEITRGRGAVIAIIDQAIDTTHPEFCDRVVACLELRTEKENRWAPAWPAHGTQCAGIALAQGRLVSGVAPEASLVAIHLPFVGGKPDLEKLAGAIRWAARHGADVICCPFGPPAETPRDPRAGQVMKAITWAARWGRDRKGSIVVFSAGNEGIDLEFNPYACHPLAVAVGACNAAGRRCHYSNFGKALWCVFPSGDALVPAGRQESLLLTTTPLRPGVEVNPCYDFTVGHTSAAAAGISGLCALVLSADPELTRKQVKSILRRSCRRIGEPSEQSESRPSPQYDAAGPTPWLRYAWPPAPLAGKGPTWVRLTLQWWTSGSASGRAGIRPRRPRCKAGDRRPTAAAEGRSGPAPAAKGHPPRLPGAALERPARRAN